MYKVFWILIMRQWHPLPTTGQVLQSSPSPDLISEEEDSTFLEITSLIVPLVQHSSHNTYEIVDENTGSIVLILTGVFYIFN